MDPNAPSFPQQQPSQGQAPPNAGLDKAVDQVVAALGKYKRELHSADSSSPFVDALHQIEMALLEVHSQATGEPMPQVTGEPAPGTEPGESPGMEGAMEPPMEAAQEYGDQPPTSMHDAAVQTQDLMRAAAKKRLGGGR